MMNVKKISENQEQLYSVMKELLPQLQNQLKQDLQTKYNKAFYQRQLELKRQLQQHYNKKIEKALIRKQEQMKLEFERINHERSRKQDKRKEQHMEKQLNQIKDRLLKLERENQVLHSQKSNWVKLQKGYQKALRDLGNEEISNASSKSDIWVKPPSEKEKTPVQIQRQSFSLGVHKIIKPIHQLSIQTKNFKDSSSRQYFNEESYKNNDINYYTEQTDNNQQEMQGILSPPSVDPHLIDSVLELNSQIKTSKKQIHWNEEKKQELLKMIRQKMK